MKNRTTSRLVFCFSLVLAGLPGSAAFAVEAPTAPAPVPTALDRCAALADPVEPLLVDFGFHAQCTAIAECAPFTDVSCNQGGTCVGVDRNCDVGERGYVTCSGATTYCGGACCGSDGVCEYDYGCLCDDPDCAGRPECPTCEQNGVCDLNCGCDDPDCHGTRACRCPETGTDYCSTVTNCVSDLDCCNPGSVCTSSGVCLCT